MLRLKRRVTASTSQLANQHVMSPNEIVDFLSQILELNGCAISLEDSPTGSLLFVVGDNAYELVDATETVM
ncbi:MAG: hypothetical protein HFE78_05760 [Clostridiales bacterium]|nr:hypothetical protein [Clostridiales bacterium]